MSKIFAAALLGAISIFTLSGLGGGEAPAIRDAPAALPQVAADAAPSDSPRECSIARNVTSACTYQ